jgi:DNA mismatch endonuclease (patch repair protein)
LCRCKASGVRNQHSGVAQVEWVVGNLGFRMDIVSCVERSERMRAIRREGTSVESRVACSLRQSGFRCVCNDNKLPGSPDIVIASRNTVIFVHGCFWHRHNCRAGRCIPKTRRSFWVNKFRENAARDSRVARQLRRTGWHVLVVWECQARGKSLQVTMERLCRRLRAG